MLYNYFLSVYWKDIFFLCICTTPTTWHHNQGLY